MRILPVVLLASLAAASQNAGVSAGTACADEKGDILGEVSSSGSISKQAVTDTNAVVECDKESAQEHVEACIKKFGEDKVYQVGKRVTNSKVAFTPFVVVEGGRRTTISSNSTVKAYKKPPPPPPKPKTKGNDGNMVSPKSVVSFIAIISLFILCQI